MGRKNRHALIQGQKGGAKKGEGSKATLNKTKKGKNVFKVASKKKDKAKKAAANFKKVRLFFIPGILGELCYPDLFSF